MAKKFKVRRKSSVPQIDHRPPITEIPGLPKSGGPPSVGNHEGKRAFVDGGQHCLIKLGEGGRAGIYFDGGALRWLWETAEAQALAQYRKYGSNGLLPEMTEASIRAVEAIRDVGHSFMDPPPPPKKRYAVKRAEKRAPKTFKVKRSTKHGKGRVVRRAK